MSVSQQPNPQQRRRGRSVLLSVVAVLLAIAIPVAVIQLLRGGGSQSPSGEGSSTTAPSTPSSSTAPPSTSPSTATPGFTVIGKVKLDPANAPADAVPAVDYARGLKIHTTEGTVPLPLARGDLLWAFAPHSDGWIVTAYRPKINDGIARVVDGTGYVSAEWLMTGPASIARGWDDSTAYVVADAVQVDDPDGVVVQGWPLPVRGEYAAAGILPDGSVIVNDTARGRVYVGAPQTALAIVKGVIAVKGVSVTGRVTTLDSLKDAGSCSSMRENLAATPIWSTCDYTLGTFNPSGSLVVGHPAYQDGLGDWMVSILDADTGTSYVDFTTTSNQTTTAFINAVAWEDDTHLLAQVFSSEAGWRILRLGVDGTVTNADLGDLGHDEMQAPLTFVVQP